MEIKTKCRECFTEVTAYEDELKKVSEKHTKPIAEDFDLERGVKIKTVVEISGIGFRCPICGKDNMIFPQTETPIGTSEERLSDEEKKSYIEDLKKYESHPSKKKIFGLF